ERRTSQAADGERQAVQGIATRELITEDARHLRSPASGHRRVEQTDQDSQPDRNGWRNAAAEQRQDRGEPQRVPGERGGEQPPRPRAPVKQRAEQRPADRSRNRQSSQ